MAEREKRVLLGMSGGVDSSVAACLLREAGYEVCGVTMQLFRSEEIGLDDEGGCCSLSDVEDARGVCHKLDIPHYTLNFDEQFGREVIGRFADGYRAGVTPNPCIDCNRFVRFPGMLHKADVLDCRHIATGHYARVAHDEASGRTLLKKAADPAKDQSYVLYALTQEQLGRLRFPLGEYTKGEARAVAARYGLNNAQKPDSQDICFVRNGSYADFLTGVMGVPAPEGDFVDLDGAVLGRHKGCIRYTIGQRRGLGIAAEKPLYVIGKDMGAATVTLGGEKDLFAPGLRADGVNWIAVERPEDPMELRVKIRYGQREVPATVTPEGADGARVRFEQPQRAVSPGQAVVFYDGDVVVGGGTIRCALPGEELA